MIRQVKSWVRGEICTHRRPLVFRLKQGRAFLAAQRACVQRGPRGAAHSSSWGENVGDEVGTDI